MVGADKLNGITKMKTHKTDNGIKDTYQEFYIEKASGFIRSLNGRRDVKERRIKEFVTTHLPENPVNPLFRIPGRQYI